MSFGTENGAQGGLSSRQAEQTRGLERFDAPLPSMFVCRERDNSFSLPGLPTRSPRQASFLFREELRKCKHVWQFPMWQATLPAFLLLLDPLVQCKG